MTAPPTTAFGSLLTAERVLDYRIRPLYAGMPGLSGPAFTVRLEPRCNLMLHAAIYHAPVGSVLVVQSPDRRHAVAGGNVCLTAQQNGIAGMVIDGVIRDGAEIEAARFPVFALGTSPIPGSKEPRGEWQQPLQCGGVTVHPGDWIVADSEGILCLPAREAGPGPPGRSKGGSPVTRSVAGRAPPQGGQRAGWVQWKLSALETKRSHLYSDS